ncbi:MAG: phosphoribosylformylglycinamidine synthase I [Chloroflexi bacterium]|nr:phosphoribosylformylglycinamidine synthase I [Chloroflexota bacterium]
MQPKALVLQAHGTNRDLDAIEALALAGARPEGVPLNLLRAGKKHFADYQMLVIPGGFSYADALGAGRLLALDLKSYFADEMAAFVDAGRPVMGICNGFQALVKAGILPGNGVLPQQLPSSRVESDSRQVTLTFNRSGRFECRWVRLAPLSRTCIWTRGLREAIDCPVAHGEGNFQAAPGFPLDSFAACGQVALAYLRADGSPANGEYPANPNGSLLDIAGICNPPGNVLGLMPHPENHIHAWQHPLHTRHAVAGSGLALFQQGVEYASQT